MVPSRAHAQGARGMKRASMGMRGLASATTAASDVNKLISGPCT